MDPKLLRSALYNENPQLSSPEYLQGNYLNQSYGTEAFNQPPVATNLQPYIQSNAGGILGLALQDAILGRPQKGQSYLDKLSGMVGFNTPRGYGMDLGFRQPSPVIQRDVLDWNVNMRFPFNL